MKTRRLRAILSHATIAATVNSFERSKRGRTSFISNFFVEANRIFDKISIFETKNFDYGEHTNITSTLIKTSLFMPIRTCNTVYSYHIFIPFSKETTFHHITPSTMDLGNTRHSSSTRTTSWRRKSLSQWCTTPVSFWTPPSRMKNWKPTSRHSYQKHPVSSFVNNIQKVGTFPLSSKHPVSMQPIQLFW